MAKEVELKFDLDPGDVGLLRSAPLLIGTQAESGEHDTVYFDTAGQALRKAGLSLRVRRTGGRFVQTLKRRNGGAFGLFVRGEWEREIAGPEPRLGALPAKIADRLRALIVDEPLVEAVRSRFTRTRWLLHRGRSRIEVVLDEGRVTSGAYETPICEVELELLKGRPAALFRLAEALGESAPLRLGVLSKGERGFALASGRLGRTAMADPVRLAPELDRRMAFQIVARSCLGHYRLNEIALLAGGREAETLHQARVALRRLRSALVLFRPILAGREYRQLREELRWLFGLLGAGRDLDVAIVAAAKPSPALLRRRDRAYEALEAALAAPRARRLMLRLATWLEGGAWRLREDAAGPLGPFAGERLGRLWAKVERRGARIDRLDGEACHRLRVDAKKLRYSAEFLAGLSGPRGARARRDRFIAALKEIQDRLGEYNDRRLGLRGPAAEQGPAVDPAIAAAHEAWGRAAATAGYWRD